MEPVSKVFFHVDLDAFFASVEQLDDPSLKGKPVIVGAMPGRRGVVSTCSYEARAFGVHSAMPISEAFKRCPQGVYLPPRGRRYAERSAEVMSIFEEFTPDLRRMSIDEAFMDMTGTERLWGPPAEAAALLKRRVREETGLGISVGVAPNPYVAKIASGLRKPDGLVVVEPDRVEAFMLELPLAKLWGAGEKTQERFRELGILSTAQLASFGQAQMASIFGNAGGAFLYDAVRGRDPGMLSGGEAGSRSMSAETTFERDCADRERIESVLLALSDELAYRLWAEGFRSRTLVLKLRLHDFTTVTRRATRPSYFLSSEDTVAGATALLDKAWDGRSEIRLLGLGLAELEKEGAAIQGELFADGSERSRKAQAAVFEIERKGLGKVTRARLLGKGGRGHLAEDSEGEAESGEEPSGAEGDPASEGG
jgi:DNA polymerase IV